MAVTNPIQVATDPQYRLAGGTNNGGVNPFYFKVGTNLYQVLMASQLASPKAINIFKRAVSDIGGTWVEKDSANSPDAGSQKGDAQAFYNSGTGIIAVMYMMSDGTGIKIAEFDTGTDTWGAPSAELTYTTFGTTFVFVQRSDATYVVIGTTTSAHAFYATYNGAWSATTVIIASGVEIFGGIIDPNDVIHFLLNQSGFALHYRQLSAAYALGSATQIAASIPFNEGGIPTLVFWGSASIAIGYIHNSEVHASIGTPLAAPAFTDHTVYTATSTPARSTVVVDLSGALNLFFILYDAGSSPIVDEMDYSTFDGVSTWTAPTLFYDETAYPPANAPENPADEFLHTLQPIELDQGWTAATTMETVVAAQNYCTGFFLEVTGPTLRLTKTVSGGTAMAAMWLLTGTGSSQTVSGAGDTGVVSVANGTYALSESTGPDGYTAGAWDCGAAVMPTPTTVIVNDSGTATVLPYQIPSDSTYSQFLNGTTPTYFHVGTNLYCVLCNAHTLGVFKRAAASAGGSWTLMDSSHSPDAGSQSRYAKVTINSGGTILAVAYLTTGQTSVKICTFNTGTDTWGTATAGVTVESPLTTFAFVQRSDNTFVVVGGGTNHLYYITNTGGTWSGPTNLFLNPTKVIDGCIDSSDRIHFLDIAVSPGTEYRQLSSTYVLGSPSAILAATSPTAATYPSIRIWAGTAIAITGIDFAGAPAFKAQVFIGTPLATPSLTAYTIATPAAGHTLGYVRTADSSGGALNSFYTDTDISTPFMKVMQSTFDGVSTWSAPTAFYDAVANPPSNGVATAGQAIQGTQAIDLAAGWTIASAMNTTGPVSTGELIESITPTGQVVCTITNTFGAGPFTAACPSPIYVVGTPYDSFVTVTGGTGPYTFALKSGSLPTGLSLNASTGEITGTPSADGPFSFVIEVTDSLGAKTDTSTCSAGRCPGTKSLL